MLHTPADSRGLRGCSLGLDEGFLHFADGTRYLIPASDGCLVTRRRGTAPRRVSGGGGWKIHPHVVGVGSVRG